MYRLSLVMCAFLFSHSSALRMRCVKIIVDFSRIGSRRSPPQITECVRILFTVCVRSRFIGSQIISFYSSSVLLQFPSVKSNGGATVSVVTTSGNKCRSSLSFSDQSLTMQSVSFKR
ncbi:hypothetical protein F5888DRAFT_602846 [Russula emetica]|nr:hypothetical protein F5888DRAFT_602846 [Russula emetica]